MAPPDVAVEGLTLRHVGRRAPALRDLSLRWAPGERLLLLGPSGSGKSTLTLCLNGVIPHSLEAHWEAGRVLLDGEDTRRADPGDLAGRVGVLFQDPETQLVMLEVDDEIAFGLECLGVPPEEMRRRVAAARAAVGLAGERTPARLEALSGGAKQRVTLAAVLAMGPRALVADEPTANLDPAGARLALRLLRAAARGRSLLLVEHRLDELGGLIDRVAVLDGQGHLALEGPPGRVFGTAGARLDALGVWTPQYATLARRLGAPPDTVPQSAAAAADLLVERWPAPPSRPLAVPAEAPAGPPSPPAGTAVLALDGVSYRYPGAPADAVHRLPLEVRGGDFLALVGPNGAGKSTLGLLLAGVLPPTAGRVFLDGRDLAAHDERTVRRRLAYVFQYPEHQFAGRTVREDVLVGLRRLGIEPAAAGRRAAEALERFGLAALAEASPYLLSHGQKRRLSVATALVLRPEVLILDEPTFGQDRRHA
ncbi:MAG TPA: ABC transporter ATP-binding protein, partial [Chloroflexota bacterium]|nr:ABC transporter ATP-binding protein [Chloroflexota bacterium]